jgi:glycosyltransferase involved in cell wall biosynthesis
MLDDGGRGPAALRVALFGTYDEDRHPRVRVLRQGLQACGAEVVVVNAPLGLDTGARLRIARAPWLAPLLLVRLAMAWVRLWWRARRVEPVDAVLVGYLGHFDVHLARRLFRSAIVVLDHMVSLGDTARDRRVADGSASTRLLDRIDRAALRAADLVLLDTEEQHAQLPLDVDARTLVVPVGAPEEWYRTVTAQDGAERGSGVVRVVFFGLYTPLQGAPVIGEAMAAVADRPDIAFTMIGDGQDLPAARAAAGSARADWVSWVDASALPDLVAAHDVCLGIFGTSQKAQRVVPNKVYQGAAAGCLVITSDTPCQRRAMGDAARYVPPGDSRALAELLALLADHPDRLLDARRRSREHADEFAPAAVVAPLVDALRVAAA